MIPNEDLHIVDRDLYWKSKKASEVLWIVKCGGIYD